MKRFIYLLLLFFLIVNLSYRIDLKKSPHTLIGELMYFPSGNAVRALSLGFYASLADLVWLRFIQYYGEHRLTDARFDLMYHILDILTTLDPNFTYAYTLGALMLATDAKRPDLAEKLLKRGMAAYPDQWRIPFFYGFINYVFLRDYKVAEAYFRLSAQRPNAPDITWRWAGYILFKRLGDLKTALALWLELCNNSKNPEEKAIAKMYIKEITMLLDIEFLNNKIKDFKNKLGRPPLDLSELVVYGMVDSIPNEPHGKTYIIRKGEAYSTWQTGKK